MTGPARFWRMVEHAVREALFLRAGWAVLGAVGLAGGCAGVLSDLSLAGDAGRLITDLVWGAVQIGGSLLAALLPAALTLSPEARTNLDLLRLRGVSRVAWLAARMVAVAVLLVWLVVAVAGVSAFVLHRRGYVVEGPAWTQDAWLTLLRLGVIAAQATWVAAWGRSMFVASGVALALVVSSQMADVLEWAGRTQAGDNGGLWLVMARLLPHLARFNPGETPDTALLVYGTGWASLYGLVAAWLFSRRED